MTLSFRSAASLLSAACLPLLLITACQSSGDAHQIAAHVEAPPVDADQAVGFPGLHNVVTYAPDVVCGGAPEGHEGLEALKAMGIKTIITVDGAAPDAKGAEALGMHYIHLPISYDTVTPERQKELAQAVASSEGPIYMHCHHGKHRSAAALGSALVLAGKMTPEQAVAKMEISGTSPAYKGLWKAVREAEALPEAQLHVDPKVFPSVAKTSGMVQTMSEVDMVFDLVKQAEKAGWKAPEDHPDLNAPKETKRLATLFANLKKDKESMALPADYQQMLDKAITDTAKLDELVHAGDAAAAAELLKTIGTTCKDCHKVHRD
ncbi:MAG: cytochrome c [Planctomycetes bacterium]|nr:cytochrome c [Planctomycetota bacterium]